MITIQECKQKLLDELHAPYKNCTLCPLSIARTNVVFGRGNPDAKLMLVGEAPGAQEDIQGLNFVGLSGKLLSRTLLSLSIPEHELYIASVVKCRPPQNRLPTPQEASTCTKILLYKQIEIINPTVICALGAFATEWLLGNKTPISKIRGQGFTATKFNSIVLPTFHPAYILRSPKQLPFLAQDLQSAFTLSNSKQK